MARNVACLVVVALLSVPAFALAKGKPAKGAPPPAKPEASAPTEKPRESVIVPCRGSVTFTKSLTDPALETAKFAAFRGDHWNICGTYHGADVKLEIRPDRMSKIEFVDEIKYGPERGRIRPTGRANGNSFTVQDAVICHADGAWDSNLVLLMRDPIGDGYIEAFVKLYEHYIKQIEFE